MCPFCKEQDLDTTIVSTPPMTGYTLRAHNAPDSTCSYRDTLDPNNKIMQSQVCLKSTSLNQLYVIDSLYFANKTNFYQLLDNDDKVFLGDFDKAIDFCIEENKFDDVLVNYLKALNF